MHSRFKTTSGALRRPAMHAPTHAAAAGQVFPSRDALLPDLSTPRCKIRLNFPARGTDKDLGEERDDHHQLLGEQLSSSPPHWKYPALHARPQWEEESPKYVSADLLWPSPGRSARKETLPACLPATAAQTGGSQTGPRRLAGTTSPCHTAKRSAEPCRITWQPCQLPAWTGALLPVDLDEDGLRIGRDQGHSIPPPDPLPRRLVARGQPSPAAVSAERAG